MNYKEMLARVNEEISDLEKLRNTLVTICAVKDSPCAQAPSKEVLNKPMPEKFRVLKPHKKQPSSQLDWVIYALDSLGESKIAEIASFAQLSKGATVKCLSKLVAQNKAEKLSPGVYAPVGDDDIDVFSLGDHTKENI